MHPVEKRYFAQELRKSFIAKAIVLHNVSNFMVFLIYGSEYKIAFYVSGDETWTQLEDADRVYCDVITSKNNIYALSTDGYVEGWDFHKNQPKKFLDIRPSGERDEEKLKNFLSDKFSSQFYLVEDLMGELLLVKRFIGNFVNHDGVAMYEGELLSPEDTQPLIYPYRTKYFSVCKLNFFRRKWEKVKCLKDQVLFVGSNESASLSAQDFSECDGNSVYFSDDRWEEMNLDDLYGGHDFGVFSLGDEIVKPLMPNVMDKIDPPAIWIVPTLDM
ncbi:hypothetical protein L6164_013039 [Bauhinia variegata]|nr:hypothetical protein L6164_013039 [Bauhinia variegata]